MNDNNVNLVGKLYVAGTRGYSNYEIAVQNGFEGTEEEWLQTMFDYAGQISANSISQKILDGTYHISFDTVYTISTEELVLELSVINPEGGE